MESSPPGAGLDETEQLLVDLSRVRPVPGIAADRWERADLGRLLLLGARIGNFNLIARRILALHPRLDAATRTRTERNLNHIDLRERLAIADVAALAGRLREKGEPLLLLKGGAYGRFLYPERGLRSFLDVDVLIRPQAVPAALAVLEELGYWKSHEIEGSIDLSRQVGTSPITLKVEIHTDLVHHYQYPYYRAELVLEEGRLMERAEERVLDGARVLILRAPDELLYSVLHFFFHHDMKGLKYHSDLNALLTDPDRPLDLEESIAVARQARAGYAVGLALLVQEAVFGPGAVPPRLLEALAPRGLRRALLRLVLPPLARLPLLEGRVAGHPAKVLVAPGAWAPLGLGLRWLFPGRSFLMSFYGVEGEKWQPSYHLRYPAAILRKALRRALPGGSGA